MTAYRHHRRRPAGRPRIFPSPEDMITLIAGPRIGRSTAYVIPAIADAPGAVLTASNKRDVLDATGELRATGGQMCAFDPQSIALEAPAWWWNPLSYVTDDVKAAKLAAHFASGSRSGDSRGDAYFDNAGQDLLAGFLLAAALEGLPITTAFTWTTTPGDDEPVRILRRHGYEQMADAVSGQVNGESRRRDSVYGTAAQMASCLKVRAIAQWVTPQGSSDPGLPSRRGGRIPLAVLVRRCLPSRCCGHRRWRRNRYARAHPPRCCSSGRRIRSHRVESSQRPRRCIRRNA